MSDDLHAIVKRIDKGKPEPGDIEALQKAVRTGGLAALGSNTQVRKLIEATGSPQSAQAVIATEVCQVREALGYNTAQGVEKLLIEHIALCWLRLQMAESYLTNNTTGEHSRDSGRYWESRLEAAQRRYLRAVGLLERLRRYAPNVQINIANQQVVQGPG